MTAEQVNNFGSFCAFIVAALIAVLFVGTFIVLLLQQVRGGKGSENGKKSESVPEAAAPVDMTPPVLTHPIISNDQVSKPVTVVVEAEATAEKVSDTTFSTEVRKVGSKAVRKNTANDPASWACPKSFFGVNLASAPQAVRSMDPQRKAKALRLREEAAAQAAAARKAEVKRANKFKKRLKQVVDAARHQAELADEAALLEHCLRAEGAIN